MADLPGYTVGPVMVAGSDDHLMAGHREPAGQASSLRPGAAEDADDKPVKGRRLVLGHKVPSCHYPDMSMVNR
jgi:hypothetical protein